MFVFETLKKIRVYGLRRVITYIVPEIKRVFRKLFHGSYSHLGEDLVLSKSFQPEYKGFYVDVGANDPRRLNNTYYFYKRGWRGINIEPDPVCYRKILKYRPGDINLNIGISDTAGNINFHFFFPSLLNTFSKDEADRYVSQGYQLNKISSVEVKKLDDVLEKYLPSNTPIDILCIDTEGYDYNVLKSIDLKRYKPRLICVECSKDNISDKIEEVLNRNNYSLLYSNGSNSIYRLSL